MAGDGGEFRLVGHEHVDVGEQRHREGFRRSRCWVEDHGAARSGGGSGNGVERHLELQKGDGGGIEDGASCLDVGGSDPGIRAGTHHDRVVAVGSDRDQRDAVGDIGGGEEMAGVDAVTVKGGSEHGAALVIAETPDHRNVSSEACSRDGLVGALAAGDPTQVASEDGFPDQRDGVDLDDEIEVRATDDGDLGHRISGPRRLRARTGA